MCKPMPDMKFYFGDLAVTPLGETGEVVGILLRELTGGEAWFYRLKGTQRLESTWWRADALKRPSEVNPLEPFAAEDSHA